MVFEIINPFRFTLSCVILNAFSAVAFSQSPSMLEFNCILVEARKAVP